MGRKNSKTISFGRGRRWLNPQSNDCKAGIVWTVEVTRVPRDEGPDGAYMEAYLTSTEESQNHWVYKRGDLAPLAVSLKEIARFKKACEDALEYIKKEGLDYDPH